MFVLKNVEILVIMEAAGSVLIGSMKYKRRLEDDDSLF